MTKGDTLSRRAAVMTGIVALTAAAVMTLAYCILQTNWSRNRAADSLTPQARTLAEAAAEYVSGDKASWDNMTEVLASANVRAYLTNHSGRLEAAATLDAMPKTATALVETALAGKEAWAVVKTDGAWLYCAQPVWVDGAVYGVLLMGQPFSSGMGAYWISLALAAAAALAAAYPLLKVLIVRAVEPVKALRDVAVKIAGGDFEARVNEHVPGELGELGVALNNMSYQLSRTLYTLILERNRLKHMIDGLSEGIVAVNAKGHVTHQNPALKRMFPEDAARQGADARLRIIADKSIWEDFDSVVRKGGVITRNIEAENMVVRLVISPIIDEIGATAGAVGLFSDITQQERLERTRREYVANVSHEMRTPLTAMRALIEPLKEGMVTSEDARMRYYDIILREILRLSRLINDQLELSRLQSGTLAIQKERMRLEDLVLDVCDRYSSIAQEHSLKFDLDTDFGQCPAVYSNADRIEQMMVILLDNAIKYTPEGGSIAVSATWDEKNVTMCVSDTGVGIAREDLPYVFDRFYKVDKAHSGKGSGLGLSIAKELLMRMGEEIWVVSEQGKGSKFFFTIKRAGPENAGA